MLLKLGTIVTLFYPVWIDIMTAWSRDELIALLPNIDWQFQQPLQSEVWQQYLEFYRLDHLHNLHPQVQHHAGTWSVESHQLVLQSWRWSTDQARQTAIIVHGYYDHVGLYGSLIDFCLQQGWNVVCCDLPGHGLSSGAPAAISCFQTYDTVLDALVQQLGLSPQQPGHLLAQSMGGAIATNYLLTRNLTKTTSPFEHVALFAPLIRPAHWWRVKTLHTLLSPFITRFKRGITNSSNDPDFLQLVNERDPLQATHLSIQWLTALRRWITFIDKQNASEVPVILIQGDQEFTVDHSYNVPWLSSKFPNHIRLQMPGMRHHLVNETEPLRHGMYQALNTILQRRTSYMMD